MNKKQLRWSTAFHFCVETANVVCKIIVALYSVFSWYVACDLNNFSPNKWSRYFLKGVLD